MIFCNYSSPFIKFNNDIMIIIVRKIIIFDVTVPGDKRIGQKESKKSIRSLKEKFQGCETKELSTWYQWLQDYGEVQQRTWISWAPEPIFIVPKAQVVRNSNVSRARRWTLRDPQSQVMITTDPTGNFICITPLITLHCLPTFSCHWLP